MTAGAKIISVLERVEKISRLLDERTSKLEQKLGIEEKSSGLPAQPVAANTELIFADLGPITSLIRDNRVSDILINGTEPVFIECNGKLEETDIRFNSDEEVYTMAQKICRAVGRHLDPERPFIDARLPDGSRVNIIAPPLALDGTSISIRKFPEKIMGLDDLVQLNCMSQEMAEFFKICARSRVNILIVGGTGSGKTTLLNSLAQHVGEHERVVTIEDAAELRIDLKHKVRLEAKPYVHGKPKHTEVTIRDLVMNALRMRPDRIIVGETRGGEAFDMIQAMSTGHDGSMTTIHANSSRDALLRLENMISMAMTSMPPIAIRQRIGAAIELVITLARLDDGSRKITQVTEITGMERETMITQNIFEYKQTDGMKDGIIQGTFVKIGIMPKFSPKCFKFGFKKQLSQIFSRGQGI